MMTRSRHPSSSDQNESDNGSNSTCLSQHSSQHRRGTGHKPSEVFRTDLITAMKIPDSYTLNPDDFYILTDPWKQEWEKGVQVPVNPHVIPQPGVRVLEEKGKAGTFVLPKKLVRASGSEASGYPDMNALAERTCRYDLDDEDVGWLAVVNQQFSRMALPLLDETRMELMLEDFERRCHENMAVAVETQEGLGIEFDEDVVCDVCRSPDGEDGNEMVFCDKCNICVHQACYGIQKVPTGSWLCRICALGILPKCELCPKNGGAMKPTRSGTKWIHVSCALWIPEVSIGNPEKMEPIINVSRIPSSRWALTCCICKEKSGACIQCSVKKCRTAFHVTCSHHAGLEMSTTLTEEDEVKFKVFCPRHSGLEGEEDTADATGNDQNSAKTPKRTIKEESVAEAEKRVSLRKLKLQEMENEFYKFVDPAKVAAHLKVSRETVDFVFQYWKLKRKTNFNRPLLIPKKDEEENLARREQELLRKRLQLFTHLRQDLERVRNLTYMVTRREKMKRSMWRIQEQIFQHQVRLLDHKLISGDPSSKDLEQLLSLGLVWSQSSLNHSSSSSSSTSRKSKHHKKKKRRKSREHRDPTHSSPSQNPFLQTNESQTQRNITCDAQFELQNEEIQPREVEQFDQEVAVKVESKRREDGEVLMHKRNHKKQEKSKRSTQNGFKEKQLSIHLVDIRHKDSDSYVMYGEWEANNAKARLKANPTVPNGLSKKHQANGAANGRSWGKFRIPKRKFENEDLNEQRKAMLKPLTNSKQTLDTDTDMKRCNRNEAMLTRRYDFIHRGVLAS